MRHVADVIGCHYVSALQPVEFYTGSFTQDRRVQYLTVKRPGQRLARRTLSVEETPTADGNHHAASAPSSLLPGGPTGLMVTLFGTTQSFQCAQSPRRRHAHKNIPECSFHCHIMSAPHPTAAPATTTARLAECSRVYRSCCTDWSAHPALNSRIADRNNERPPLEGGWTWRRSLTPLQRRGV